MASAHRHFSLKGLRVTNGRSHIWPFLAAQEILDQREVRDRVGGAIDLGDPRTTMRKLQGYDCVQFTALVFGKSWASQARVKLQFTSLSKFYRESPSNYFDFDNM
jgi:hypothetical protein